MEIEYLLTGLILIIFLFDFLRKKNKDSTEQVVKAEIKDKKPIWLLSLFIITLLGLIIGLFVDYITNNNYDSNGYFSKNVFEYIKNFRYSDKALINYIFSLLPTLGLGVFILKTKELKFRTYLLKRKKNIALTIISIPIIKVLMHYFFYPERISSFKNGTSRTKDLGYHINLIFDEHLLLFIPSLFLVLFFAWFFNDKIKAR